MLQMGPESDPNAFKLTENFGKGDGLGSLGTGSTNRKNQTPKSNNVFDVSIGMSSTKRAQWNKSPERAQKHLPKYLKPSPPKPKSTMPGGTSRSRNGPTHKNQTELIEQKGKQQVIGQGSFSRMKTADGQNRVEPAKPAATSTVKIDLQPAAAPSTGASGKQ